MFLRRQYYMESFNPRLVTILDCPLQNPPKRLIPAILPKRPDQNFYQIFHSTNTASINYMLYKQKAKTYRCRHVYVYMYTRGCIYALKRIIFTLT